MSFSPTLNVIVLGVGESARAHLAAIKASKETGLKLPSGLRVSVGIGLWSSPDDRAEMAKLVREFGIGLVGHDPAQLIQAHDVHVVVGCLPDSTRQAESLRIAVAAGKAALAIPPIGPDEATMRDLATLAETIGVPTAISLGEPASLVKAFLESVIRREKRLPSWIEWVDRAFPAPLDESADPATEIRAALAALPADAVGARLPLERALRALEQRENR